MASMRHNPLQRLIEGVKDANKWSDEDIARRARERGHALSKQTISDYRTKGITTVVPDRMRALADGLGLPAERVGIAALATIGLARYAGDPTLAEDAVMADESLPEATRRAVLAIIADARQVAGGKVSDVDATVGSVATRRHGKPAQPTTSPTEEDESTVVSMPSRNSSQDTGPVNVGSERRRAARTRKTPRTSDIESP